MRRRAFRLPLLVAIMALGGAAGAQEPPLPSKVIDISVLPATGAATRLQVVTDTNLRPEHFTISAVTGGAPRVLLKLRGIATPYAPARIGVDDQNLVTIRTGFHPEHQPPELHVVLDLSSAEVELLDTRIDGPSLLIILGSPTARTAPPAASPTPRPTPRPTARPQPTPIPTPRPTARPQPTAAPTPPLRPTAIPTQIPTRMPTAKPTATVAARPTPAPEPPRVAPGGQAATTTVIYRADEQYVQQESALQTRQRQAKVITEIVVSRSNDSSTLVRLTADAPFAQRLFRHEPPTGDPPLHRLYLSGIELPGAPSGLIPIDGPAVSGIEIIPGNELEEESQVVLHLGSPQVRITRVASRGPHLVLGFGITTPSPEEDVIGLTMPARPPVAVTPELKETGTTITNLEVVRQSDDATVIRLTTDGPITRDRYHLFPVTPDPPRAVLSIRGVTMPDAPTRVPVHGPCLTDVGIVHQQGEDGDALQLVLNLVSEEVEVTYVTFIDKYLLIRLLPPEPVATAVPPAQPSTADQVPVAPPVSSPTLQERATRINEIGYWHRGDGTTVVMVAANGPIEDGSFRQEERAGDSRELVLRLSGIEQPYQPSLVEINDPRVETLRIVYRGDRSPPELELIFHVTSSEVMISQILRRETTLLIHLE